MTTEDVLKALGRYKIESHESDRRTAAMLGIKRATLIAWLQGADPPQKWILLTTPAIHPQPSTTVAKSRYRKTQAENTDRRILWVTSEKINVSFIHKEDKTRRFDLWSENDNRKSQEEAI